MNKEQENIRRMRTCAVDAIAHLQNALALDVINVPNPTPQEKRRRTLAMKSAMFLTKELWRRNAGLWGKV